MKSLVALALGLTLPLSALAQDTPASVTAGTVPFTQSVLVTDLAAPWEITWGPDDMLWVTERAAGRIIRVNPTDGTVSPAIVMAEVSAPGWQDGLLGLALHPELLTSTRHDFVYTAYTMI